MKALRIPCFLLLLLLVLSLLNSVWLSRQCSSWTAQIDRIDTLADSRRWEQASVCLENLYADWSRCQTWLHTVIEHREIDAAEALLQRCRILCQEQDDAEFRAALSDLGAQFRLLDEMERISIKNIL